MRMAKREYSIIIIVIAALFILQSFIPQTEMQYEKENAIVTNIIDGDTIVISGGQRVRLLNIDAREKGEECYNEAKQRLEQIIELKNITMEREKENIDRYGRLLRHIYFNNTNVGLLLVKEGLAFAYIISPNTKYESEFKNAEQDAMQQGGCVWK